MGDLLFGFFFSPPWIFFCCTLFFGILSIKTGSFQRCEMKAALKMPIGFSFSGKQVARLWRMTWHDRHVSRTYGFTLQVNRQRASCHFSTFPAAGSGFLPFVVVSMGPWLKPEFYVLERGTQKEKSKTASPTLFPKVNQSLEVEAPFHFLNFQWMSMWRGWNMTNSCIVMLFKW